MSDNVNNGTKAGTKTDDTANGATAGFLEAMHRGNVRAIEEREHVGFTFKPRDIRCAARE